MKPIWVSTLLSEPLSHTPDHGRQQAHGHDENDRQRQRPALVLRGENQEHQHDADRETRSARYCRRIFCWNVRSVHS